MPRFLPVLLTFFFLFFSSINIGFAQTENGIENAIGAETVGDALPDPATWKGILDTISQAIERDGLLSSELNNFLVEIRSVNESATGEVDALEVQVDQLKAQLDELGPKPGDGDVAETDEIALQRESLSEQYAKLDARLKEAKVSLLRTEQIEKRITNQRKQRFFRKIELRTDKLYTFEFWGRFASGFSGFGKSLTLLISDSVSVFWQRIVERPSSLILLALLLLGLSYGYVKSRSILSQIELFESRKELEGVKSRFIRFCRNGVLNALLPYLIYKSFSVLGLLTARLETLLLGVSFAIGFTVLAITLMHILLSKDDGRMRLLKVSDQSAVRILKVLDIGLMVALLLTVLNIISGVIVAPFEVAVGLSLMFSMVIAFMSLSIFGTLYRDDYQLGVEQKEVPFWRIIKAVSWLICFIIIGTALFGYVALSEFLAQQLIFGLLVIGFVWLLLRFVDRNFQPLIDAQIDDGQDEIGQKRRRQSKQALILGNGIINLGVYSAAAILLMFPWGYRSSDFYQIFNDAFFGFEIGGLRFSLATILLALVLFAIGYTITVAFRNWLKSRYLPTTSLDTGVSNSISTVLGYAGFVVAAVLAVSAAGFDLSNLAFVAGALSLGIGFGLQSIVSNFVSGLILLAERPIQAGDWVVTTGGEGTVRKISVRSTEIETFERGTIIVPNSTLITDPVTNWTHGNNLGRISIAIGVGYDSDPEQVKEILLKCANDHAQVLSSPMASVFFMDFGASSLDFQLRCFLADINYSLTVKSELRFAILKALREARIEIPFPQRDVNIKSGNPNS